MSGERDRLFDPAAPAASDLERYADELAARLAPLRGEPAPAGRARVVAEFDRLRSRRRALRLAALATAAGLAFVWLRIRSDRAPRYEVRGIAGVASIGVGEALLVEDGPALLAIGEIGEVELDPASEVLVRAIAANEHRLELRRGVLRARIVAPPRVFAVDTPHGEAIDLGCAYELALEARGAVLSVSEGQVAFLFDGREVYVPAGAHCISRPDSGPSVPVFGHAAPEFVAAIESLERNPHALDADALAIALRLERRDDALSLFHLLELDALDLRERVAKRLVQAFPPPPGATLNELCREEGGDLRRAWFESAKPWFRRQTKGMR